MSGCSWGLTCVVVVAAAAVVVVVVAAAAVVVVVVIVDAAVVVGFVRRCFVVVVSLLLLVVVEGTGLRLWQLFPTDTPNGLYNLHCQPIARPVNSVVKRVLSHQGLSPIGLVFESHSWQMFFSARLITFELNCHQRSPRRVHGEST